MVLNNFVYSYQAVIAVILLLISRYALRAFLTKRSYFKSMALNNCQRPSRYPHIDPFFGLDFVRRMNNGMKQGNAMKLAQLDFESYGKTFEAIMMGMKFIHIMDYENLQAITRLEPEKFAVAPLRNTKASLWMGTGILMSDGPVWSHARKTLRPVFHRSRFENFATLESQFQVLLNQIPKDGSTVDLQPLFQQMFDNLSMEYLFGKSVKPLLSKGERFTQLFDKVLSGAASREVYGINIPSILDFFGAERSFENSLAELNTHIDKHIDEALLRRNEPYREGPDQPFVFLDELVRESQDRGFLRDQLLNVFFPARDSSAIGASCIFFILARNPEAWVKLREEVASIGEQPLTRIVIRSLYYVNQVVHESLRLLSPVNFALRTCAEDCVLPRGGGLNGAAPILVTKGTHITLNFGVMHRDKGLWGENADDFYPERWDGINPTAKDAYMPFFSGPRSCPAQEMLLMQYAYLLVRFTREFGRMDNRDEVLEFVEEHRITKMSRNGVKVAFPSRE